MTHLDQLMRYRHILASSGVIRFKTDSLPMRDFTLAQLGIAGYHLNWSVDDIREMLPDDPITGYERRLFNLGATVYALEAMPGPEPANIAQTAPLSLFDYLPDDLETMTYIPTDMERSVRNMIEARARIARNRKHDDPIAPLDARE
ncbi:MAG: hypothetical protein HGA54_01575 [Actinobacteria bacterium]|nr:hypothetical protein [Actinomycetota bacterium]